MQLDATTTTNKTIIAQIAGSIAPGKPVHTPIDRYDHHYECQCEDGGITRADAGVHRSVSHHPIPPSPVAHSGSPAARKPVMAFSNAHSDRSGCGAIRDIYRQTGS
jgi:hypothetical protein